MTAAPIAFWWGDDAYAVEAAIDGFRGRVDLFPAGPPERWRIRAEAGTSGRVIAEIHERVATASMFGSGTLAVVGNVGQLVRRGEDRVALIRVLGLVASGNGLVFAEETDSGRKEPPHRALVEAVTEAGGEVREFRAPRAGGMTAWIEARARERGLTLGGGAAKELASRIGGFVSEGDVDRRRQGQMAVMELDKLALYRLDGAVVSVDDVRALVPEAVPGSIWAFVDAIGSRQVGRALELGERLVDETPEPVMVAVLHRRIRELIEVADRLTSGESAGSLVRSMKLNPYRAEQLVRQAAAWSLAELEEALDGLLDYDATVKGVAGTPVGDAQHRLAFVRWITERVARAS